MRIAVLASGRGSNLQALLDAEHAGGLGGATIVALATDRAGCGAAGIARAAGRAVFAQRPRAFSSRAAFDAALFDALDAIAVELIVCAGYMRILSATAVARARGRMVNIHPSLLPRHPGLRTHERVLDAGEREHGASVHQVTAEVDGGPVIAQARVQVLEDDDAAALAARVLAREHPLLVACVRAIAEGQLTLGPAGVAWRGNPLHAPLSLVGRSLAASENHSE